MLAPALPAHVAGEQSSHAEARSKENDPASHHWQALSSTAPIEVEKLPLSHEMQLEVLFWSCQDPAAHCMQ